MEMHSKLVFGIKSKNNRQKNIIDLSLLPKDAIL